MIKQVAVCMVCVIQSDLLFGLLPDNSTATDTWGVTLSYYITFVGSLYQVRRACVNAARHRRNQNYCYSKNNLQLEKYFISQWCISSLIDDFITENARRHDQVFSTVAADLLELKHQDIGTTSLFQWMPWHIVFTRKHYSWDELNLGTKI